MIANFRRHRFAWLLMFIAGYLLMSPLLNENSIGRVVNDVLLTMIITITFLALAQGARPGWWAAAAWGLAVVGIWMGQLAPSGSILQGGTSLPLMFLGMAVALILRNVFRQNTVTVETIYAALCAYLLAGLFFAMIYFGIARIDPQALSFVTPLEDAGKFMWECIYFSFVTLTTLGYGDVTPHSDIARSVAFIQALSGQLYLAVLVARLVGLYTAAGIVKRDSGGGIDGPD